MTQSLQNVSTWRDWGKSQNFLVLFLIGALDSTVITIKISLRTYCNSGMTQLLSLARTVDLLEELDTKHVLWV